MPDPERTSRLSLPRMLPEQAQKHVTHNEALLRLDALVQLSVAGFGALTPPALPVEGAVHALGAAPTGAWAGQGGSLAQWTGTAWLFTAPAEGWLAHDATEGGLRQWRAGDWQPLFDGLAMLGIATAADATNRLAVSAPASLFTHAGAGHQMKLNKAAAGDTASLLFQNGFSGRAEMGLAGSDDFSVKVSPDGSGWTEALRVTRTTGQVQLPAGAVITGSVSGTAVQASAADTTAGRLMPVGAFGLGRSSAVAVTQLNDLAATGFYSIAAANAAAGNAPTANTFTVLHQQYDSNAAVQTAFQAAGATDVRMWQRIKVSGTWQAWTLNYMRANVLGAVTQASGVPTGALIETSSNANGFYTRLASGLQVCRITLAASAAAGVTWTFPAAFSAAPVVTGAATATVLSAVCLDAAPGTTTATFSARDKTDARRADTCHLTAIGRWF